MTESGFLLLKSGIMQMLRKGLNPRLTYHSPEHTQDVLLQAERIAISENITDSRTLLLIKIAALFHDTGFLDTYEGHEERSCEIMHEFMDLSLFNTSEITIICDMIAATKVSRPPVTLYQKVLCDADLDYLGREDFPVISNRLKEEFLAYCIVKNESEWNSLQVSFLESHFYYTKTSLQERNDTKMKHLATLKQNLLHPNLLM